MDTFAEENPKNYQIWYHRRAIVEEQIASLSANQTQSHGQDLDEPVTHLSAAKRELAFTAKVFAADPKNYHAWAHRYCMSVFYEYANRFLWNENINDDKTAGNIDKTAT
jgi:protein farnesyltransferase/geranylgeranyltransferase type-1 subunit alpha